MRKRLIAAAALLLIAGGCTQSAPPEKAQPAREAALAWLELIDAARYGESWDALAPFAKGMVERDSWTRMITAARQPLGDLVERDVAGTAYRTEMPGAPDGEYVEAQFTTRFENKRNAQEVLTIMKVEDEWMPAGYFIR